MHAIEIFFNYIMYDLKCIYIWFKFVGKKMDDYAKARFKESRKLTVLKMILDDGTMNADMSIVDMVHDGDLNKSLEHFVSIILFWLFF